MLIDPEEIRKRLAGLGRERELKTRLKEASRDFDKWGLLRQIYMEMMPQIWKAAESDPLGQIDPYFVDWILTFTPIENQAWQSIRSQGVPLYPQFPVLNFFLDFANPFHRVGLEIDGKDWHDVRKDRDRDEMLATIGWRIFRVSGSEANKQFESPDEVAGRGGNKVEQKQALENWLLRTCDGVVASIQEVCLRKNASAYDGLALRSLERHRLAAFDLLGLHE